ncbi:MAG: ATP-grasp domain-containing protein [Chloroflexi bacterium]|nr:ATP-grasp domain-containing protein [Chloroflexota bacterium]
MVSNRGELVPRIARTCRRLGIRCLALVPQDQAGEWWARQADETVALATDYLDAEAVLDAARRASADAIHPGYGFLAEDASFAEKVERAGLTWVGPPASAMRALGDKASGRQLAESVGVMVLPGYHGPAQDDQSLSRAAERLGLPVLIKPSAGGGGKGMHVVTELSRMGETLATARREASSAFGDDRMILERYVARPRHVEIQFLIDAHGNGVHLGERDCSLQRRHQKVIEGSPSVAVDEGLRAKLGEAALKLGLAAGYMGAGTAEFLLDDGQAYFLEVNARLQVEHPVTELVTGRDLVADQLAIACGEPLGIAQQAVRWAGHAIEARLYAEDPWAGFLPSTGHVLDVRWPSGEGVRVDAGVGTDDLIGTRYDPLLAKIICSGADRSDALRRLADALDATSILGVTTNRGLLRSLLDDPEVQAGEARTDTIERVWPGHDDARPMQRVLGAAAALLSQSQSQSQSPPAIGVPLGFRLNGPPTVRVRSGAVEQMASPDPAALAGMNWIVHGETIHLDVEGRAFAVSLASGPTVESATSRAHRDSGVGPAVIAPMPGQVRQVLVAPGDTVAAGAALIILEAMKMENAVTAPASAKVGRILVDVGDQVQRGDVLVEFE